MYTHTADGGGGFGARITYDAAQTMNGVQQMKDELDHFTQAIDRIHSQSKQTLSGLSGKSINAYEETIEEYMQAVEFAVQYMTTFVELMKIVDQQVTGADQHSGQMFRSII
ncbi:WXG100 family type VII secretion target [Numidum massiliense]|uniref:WXG100 family type VII secretion target n=1 Tax=Numidum massiliense TaxID=1522315 RepID=UPI0006D5584E|nr:hypothetical protein [Numidum massiliense]